MWYEGRIRNQWREGGNSDWNRDGGSDRNDNEDGKGYEDGDGDENGSENGDENRDDGEGEREPGSLRSGSEGESEDKRGGRRQRITSNHSRKIQHLSETVASCGGPEPRNGRQGTGLGRAEER